MVSTAVPETFARNVDHRPAAHYDARMEAVTLRRGSLVLLCFFFSGSAGLIYQVAWGKALGLVFGHTVYAVATVLAVFMGGLAIGSAWFGRQSESSSRPIALYGWIELGVAATGALSLAGLAGVRTLYVASYGLVAGSYAAQVALRFLGAVLVLFLPTFLMGGTLPVLVRGLTRSPGELGVRLARLYAVNTAGAVVGTLAAGFLLLPLVGLRRTVWTAVALNLFAGITALLISRRSRASFPPRPQSVASPARGSEMPAPSVFLLVAFAVVGATAMAYEIGWTRLLRTMLGSSTYAFTLMLATFLAGIALGSALFRNWFQRTHEVRLGTFAITQTVTGLAAMAFLVSFEHLPAVVPPILRATHESFLGLILAQFLASALAMLPAAILFGFNFPAVTLLLAGRPEPNARPARAVGRAYAANTLGAIVGATVTGFWLIPKLGSFRVVALTAEVNILLALLLWWRATPRRLPALALNTVLLFLLIGIEWTGAFYNRALATFGTVLYWNHSQAPLTVAEAAATTDVVFAVDGLNASVSVARSDDYRALRSDGKVDASTGDVITQLLVGHLGAIFHPSPRRVLVIGLGSGMTVSALARYPEVERIDCVEIEPAVLQAAPFLEPLNRGVLRDPRLHIIFDDARNFLLTTPERYDVIISEPSNPWIAGVATLFTEEYYRAARGRLTAGGVFVQWIQAYSIFPEDLRMVLGTFAGSFSHVSLWQGADPDLLVLARTEPPPPLRYHRLRRLWTDPALGADYRTLGLEEPEGLVAFYLLDDRELRRFASGSLRNTDDDTRLEYHAPRALLAHHLTDKNRERILEYRDSLLPQDLVGDDTPRIAEFRAAAATLLNQEKYSQAYRYLAPLSNEPPSSALKILWGRLSLARNNIPQARTAFEEALRLDPTSLEAAQGLANAASRRGDHPTAELLLRQILARSPQFVPALDGMMLIERSRQNWKDALDWQVKRLKADPDPRPAQYCRLAEILLHLGNFPLAEEALKSALEKDSYSYAAHHDLGMLYHRQRLWAQAKVQLEFVVRLFPDADPDVYPALADVYRSASEYKKAAGILRKGLRLFPQDSQLRRLAIAN